MAKKKKPQAQPLGGLPLQGTPNLPQSSQQRLAVNSLLQSLGLGGGFTDTSFQKSPNQQAQDIQAMLALQRGARLEQMPGAASAQLQLPPGILPQGQQDQIFSQTPQIPPGILAQITAANQAAPQQQQLSQAVQDPRRILGRILGGGRGGGGGRFSGIPRRLY